MQIITHLLTGLSITYRQLGDYAQAEQFGRRSLASYAALDDQYGIMQATLTLGELNRQLGHDDEAQQLFTQAVAVAQAIGDRSGEADGSYGLGQIAGKQGESAKAMAHLRLALEQANEIHETLLVLDILLEIAYLLVDTDAPRAGQVLTFLLDHPQLPDQRRTRAASLLAGLNGAGLTADATLSLPEVVALATTTTNTATRVRSTTKRRSTTRP